MACPMRQLADPKPVSCAVPAEVNAEPCPEPGYFHAALLSFRHFCTSDECKGIGNINEQPEVIAGPVHRHVTDIILCLLYELTTHAS